MKRLKKGDETEAERASVMGVWNDNGLEGVPLDVPSFELLLE
jgi:hypothetical protein